MNIEPEKARDIFARAVELQKLILAAQEDLKQLRTDEIEELIDEDMDKATQREIRADLSELIALAKIEARGEIEREKVAAKMAHRREVAQVVGLQLDLLDPAPASTIVKSVKKLFGKKDGVSVELRDGDGKLIARGDGKGNVSAGGKFDDFDDIPPELRRVKPREAAPA